MKARILLLTAAFVSAGALAAGAATASENWDTHCAKCHGADGKGQTKVGKKLNLKDYSSAKVQATMKDEEMQKAIAEGVKEGGKEKMKAFKGELSDQDISELVGYIRKMKK